MSTINKLINTSENFYGGKTEQFYQNWCSITSDEWILNAISGHKLEIKAEPSQFFIPRAIKFSENEQILITEEVNRFMRVGIIEEVQHIEHGQFYSNIFIRPKKEGIRVILNLKSFNDCIDKIHFKMETIKSAILNISKGDYFASVDLKDAYFSIPIHKEYRKYLRFVWNGKHYQFKVLPQGLASSPRVFTKILKPVYATLRKKGHSIAPYIDDSLLNAPTYLDCLRTITDTCFLVDSLGFTINPNKSVLVPVQIITFLGFELNSITMCIRLTRERILNMSELFTNLLQKQKITIRQFAQIIGKIVSSEAGAQFAPLFYRDLEYEKDEKLRLFKGQFDQLFVISDCSKRIINEWLEYLPKAFSPIVRDNAAIIIYSDSSTKGWGGINSTNNTQAQGIWSESERLEHINYLELKAAYLNLKALASDAYDTHIQLFLDNTVAISYINHFGGKIKTLHILAKEMWRWCIGKNIWLSATHIPGIENADADFLSRISNVDTEWMLNKHYFQILQDKIGKFDVDLFASRVNAQLENYISWVPDKRALAVDCFTIPWNFNCCYLFPPFSMISRCLQKVRTDRVSTAVCILPLWGTAVWFGEVLKLISGQSYIIPKEHALCLPNHPERGHQLKKLRLGAFLLSGQDSKIRDYQRKLSDYSCEHGKNPLLNSMGAISTSGCYFQIRNKLIHLTHLC